MKKLTRQEQQRKEKLEQSFKNDGKAKIKAAKKVGVKFWVKVYNVLCINCKLKISKNPRMNYKEYCKNCQWKIINLAKKYDIKLK